MSVLVTRGRAIKSALTRYQGKRVAINITLWFQYGSEAATILAIFVVAYQIKDSKACARRQATLEYARQTLDARHKEWELPDDYDKNAIKDFIAQCLSQKRNSSDLESALGYLNFMETLCIGAKMKIYDDETVSELYGQRMIKVNEYYAPLIRWRKSTTGNDDVYIGLQQGSDRYVKLKNKKNWRTRVMNMAQVLIHPRSRTRGQSNDVESR